MSGVATQHSLRHTPPQGRAAPRSPPSPDSLQAWAAPAAAEDAPLAMQDLTAVDSTLAPLPAMDLRRAVLHHQQHTQDQAHPAVHTTPRHAANAETEDSTSQTQTGEGSAAWAAQVYARSEWSLDPPPVTALQAMHGAVYRGHPQLRR